MKKIGCIFVLCGLFIWIACSLGCTLPPSSRPPPTSHPNYADPYPSRLNAEEPRYYGINIYNSYGGDIWSFLKWAEKNDN